MLRYRDGKRKRVPPKRAGLTSDDYDNIWLGKFAKAAKKILDKKGKWI